MRVSHVELFEQIRRDVRLDPAISQRALAAKCGVHRRTVRQTMASAIPPLRKSGQRQFRILDPATGWIDVMLRGDLRAPRKHARSPSP